MPPPKPNLARLHTAWTLLNLNTFNYKQCKRCVASLDATLKANRPSMLHAYYLDTQNRMLKLGILHQCRVSMTTRYLYILLHPSQRMSSCNLLAKKSQNKRISSSHTQPWAIWTPAADVFSEVYCIIITVEVNKYCVLCSRSVFLGCQKVTPNAWSFPSSCTLR